MGTSVTWFKVIFKKYKKKIDTITLKPDMKIIKKQNSNAFDIKNN